MIALPDGTWKAVTNLGNAGIMFPAAALIAWRLIATGQRRGAILWSLIMTTVASVVFVSKIAFLGWGIGIRSFDFTGISGHTALATAVFPVIAFLLVPNTRKQQRLLIIGLSVALGIAVGVSRGVLGVHSPSEIVSGILLGTLAAATFILSADQRESSTFQPWLIVLLVVVATGLHLGHAKLPSAEDVVVRIALYASGRNAPVTREEWLRKESLLEKL